LALRAALPTRLFQRGRGLPGETVLIHGGTGGVGTCAIQLARAAGMIVVASAGSAEGKKYVLVLARIMPSITRSRSGRRKLKR